jgi:tetratricopeptide (TPR) repeat protein
VANRADGDHWRARLRELVERRDPAALEALARQEDALTQPPATLNLLGRALATTGAGPAAAAWLRRAQERCPADFWLNYDLGYILGQLRPPQPEQAVRYLTAALALRSYSPVVYSNLGIALAANKDLEGAICCYHTAIDLDPKFAMAHNNLGLSLKDKGDVEGATSHYHTAIDLDPKCAPAHYNLGNTLHDKNDPEGAIRCYRTAIAIDPTFPPAHFNLGSALGAKGDLEGAIRCYLTAIDLNPKFAMAHNNLGLALKDKGDVEGAISHYHTAIDLDPKSAVAQNNLGIALKDKGDLNGAIRCYRTAIDLDPKFSTAHNNLGLSLVGKNDLEGAIHCFRAAIELDPKYAQAHSNLGVALENKKDQEGAMRCYRTAIKLDPKYAQAHYNLGNALLAKGDLEGGIRCFRTAIELAPKFVKAHTNLGIALHNNKDFPGAVRCFRSAIDIDPKLVQARGALGQALLAQGRFAEARTATQKALKLLQPEDPLYPYVSRELQITERLLATDAKLPAVLKGEVKPKDAAEQLGLAHLCQQYKHLYTTAVRFYASAFAEQPKLADDLGNGHRYNAACAATLATAGEGIDAAKLDDKERGRLRKQALDWLRADLAAYAKLLDKGPDQARTLVQQRLHHWQQDADLASVRGDPLANLPEAERDAWRKLCADVDALRKRVAQTK